MATESVVVEVDAVKSGEKKKVAPSWARRVPKRTIVLGAIAGVAVILFWIFQSTVALSDPNADPNALLAPWRYSLAATLLLWTAIISSAGALFSWLLHVRDIEYLRRELAAQSQLARKRSGSDN